MHEKKRERRRRDLWRMKQRAVRVMRTRWRYRSEEITPERIGAQAAKHCTHYPCWMCGNPRHRFSGRDGGMTMAERRQPQLLLDEDMAT